MKIVVKTDGVLLDALQGCFRGASKTTLRQMLRHRRVTLDGRVMSRADSPVRAGQVLEVAAGSQPAGEPPGRILLRDRHLVAIEKPSGLFSVSNDPDNADTVYRRLNEYVRETSGALERIFLVHRLDRGASGIMLFALSREAQARLKRTWSSNEKRYWALVEGRPPETAGTIRTWLREGRDQKVFSVAQGPGAKHAVTHYQVRQTGPSRSLLEVRIETGRKNQIRVHLSELGCPVVGDRKYGAGTNPLRRLGLHAFLLVFTHPASGERVRLSLPLPDEFRRV